MTVGIVPNGIKIEMNGQQNGIPVVNRFYVTQAGAVTFADLEAVETVMLNFWNVLKGGQHQSYILQNITITDVSIANGQQLVSALTSGNTGTLATAPAAANAALVIGLRTDFTGRSFRGRYYLGGLASSQFSDAQNILAITCATIAGWFEDLIAALGVIGKVMVVVSNFANGVERLTALATEIISIVIDTKVDSQRRRTAN